MVVPLVIAVGGSVVGGSVVVSVKFIGHPAGNRADGC